MEKFIVMILYTSQISQVLVDTLQDYIMS